MPLREDEVFSLFAIGGALCMIALRTQRRERSLMWSALFACAVVTFAPLHLTLPGPIWQTLTVAAGIALAAGPLWAQRAQDHRPVRHPETSVALTGL